MKQTYLYPQNLKASASLWLWSLRYFAIICVSVLLSVIIMSQTFFVLPLSLTLCFAFLSIRLDDTTILDFIRYALKYFITTQQEFRWEVRSEK